MAYGIFVSQMGFTLLDFFLSETLSNIFVHAKSGPIRDLDDVYRPLSILMRRAIETIDQDEAVRGSGETHGE